MEIFFVVPIMAAIANVSCLIENVRRDHPFHKLMTAFYLAIGFQNFSTAAMCLSPNEDVSIAWWIFQCHSFFILAPILVGMASFSTGRKILNPYTWTTLIAAIIVDFLASSMPRFFIGGFKLLSFGLSPLISPVGAALGVGVHLLSLCICIYLFARPVQWNVFFERKFFISVFLLWWFALFANLFPMHGINLPPLHPVADAALSVTLSVYLNRYNAAGFGFWRILANILISIAVGVTIGMLFWPVLKSVAYRELYVTAIAAFSACSFISFLLFHSFKTDSILPRKEFNLEGFGLSKQEIRICELLEAGHSRTFIQLILNVSNGTLRNHLKNIYAKVLPESKSTAKDQLQRLTIFLSKQKENRVTT
ncbi:LuxR family transcriptional regulator [Leptospira yasudae]|uniref:LuxR family transcriptional regulator n=1 Tax=Leptospira yasudae TaxID=2202201 RepID=A0ABX9M055_9LEPT|nr:response regulator transcription factor [Leptospira yasudae]MBW0435379.1 response regulator transcription factor [Leptospira yasudae]RHX78690.1 LuxR family transcriptional regulator [Leptospira yasudae]RHX91382.1 LuxR family transcriptional regulator [Leptospira yasudae]TGK27796.1 DNA-binding response regulator [Leptospira yasudae]TGM06921.1 DNA-binding response regulator [Leptospira yasudae]